MNKDGIKAGIASCYYTAAIVARCFRRMFPGAPARLVVLYYHSVPRESAASFARQMRALRGCAVPLDAEGPFRPGATYNAITFDDAFESVRDQGLPVMRQAGVPCSIYAPSANLGEPPRWDIEPSSHDANERVMTAADLNSISGELVKIGSHTRTHPRLTAIDDAQLHEELAGSRRELEEALGEPVHVLACPHGDIDSRVESACRSAGYKRVLGISPHIERAGQLNYVVGRVLIDPSDGPFVFFLKRKGAYAWMPTVSAIKRAVLRSA